MSFAVTTAFVQQYSTLTELLLQQKMSRLRGAVSTQGFKGKAASVVEQFGITSAQRNAGRNSDTPIMNTPQDKRWAYPQDYDWGDLTDDQDKLRMLIDPTSQYAQAGAAALGRAMDDEIIAGILGANNTGENGSSSTGVLSAYGSSSQVVGATVGASGNTGLNVAKLRAAKKILLKAEVDFDSEEIFCAISAQQNDNLYNEIQIINADYSEGKPLVDGKVIRKFMGFNFIHSERIPGATNYANIAAGVTGYTADTTWLVPFWAKSGVTLGMWNDIETRIDKRADKRFATQIYVKGTFGATRTQEKLTGIITCY